MTAPGSLRWLRQALCAFTSLRDVSLRRNLRLSLPTGDAQSVWDGPALD